MNKTNCSMRVDHPYTIWQEREKAILASELDKPPGYEPTLGDWRRLFELAGSKKATKNIKNLWGFAIRLTNTTPEIFGPAFHNGKLDQRTDTMAWRAACELLGAGWRLKTPMKEKKTSSYC